MEKTLGQLVEELVYNSVELYFMSAIGVSFLAGALLILIIQKRRPELKRELWTKYVVYLGVVALCSFLFISNYRLWFLGLICGMGMFEMIRISKTPELRDELAQVLLLYFVFCGGIFILANESGRYFFWLYALVVLFDGFSQLAGLLWGRHKLAPKISPAKTWEGLAGGFASVLITLLLLTGSFEGEQYLTMLIFAVLISAGALTGDLLASKWKRMAGVKDYGHLLPAHGGILDRFDSFMGAGGILGGAYAILSLFLK
ncbi:MAG: phosphatidate cytidylyltransferase [Bacteroidia bacterium]|jgi:phosphatidate cytidylyltransferase|nr:phosphatidate cytidylyltransferase [Bacteroidia bacterium]